MTSRSFLLALGAGLLALVSAGCGDQASTASGDVDLDSLAAGDPGDLLAYNAGFETADQLLEQDSTFSFDRFREGFAAGLRGDSTEIAYALGLRAGLGLKADTLSNINADVFLAGIRERAEKKDSRVTPEQVATASAAFQDTVQVRGLRQQAATDPAAQAQLAAMQTNAAAAQTFLAGVARRPGVQRTASGLLYTVTTPGQGASPTETDQVAIRYVGKLADGFIFDQSPAGDPVTLPVGAVVPGFSEALRMMKPGETRTVWLPPSLAYGMMGAPAPPGPDGQPGAGGIPPNSALEFQITLVSVAAGQPQMPPGMFAPGGAPGQGAPGQGAPVQ